jgi:Fe2+ or Zn2+ uptake regulation protein
MLLVSKKLYSAPALSDRLPDTHPRIDIPTFYNNLHNMTYAIDTLLGVRVH